MSRAVVGWREWVGLPQLGIARLKAKIDTGARTSALHAFELDPYDHDGVPWVRFLMHPNQGDESTVVECRAPVVAQRMVRDSGGHEEQRYVINTLLQLGEHSFMAEATLTCRDNMRFRMLVGRTALRGRFRVDPGRSYLCDSSSGEN